LKFRDGPVRVAKSTLQGAVRVEGLRPAVPAGLRAGLTGPGLPGVQQVRVAEVSAAVEDADGHALPGEAGLPGAGEVVRLRVQEVLLAEFVEVRRAQRRRVGVRHVVGLDLREGGLLLGRGRRLVQIGIGIGQRLPGTAQLDRLHRDHSWCGSELRQCLHRDRAHHESGAPGLRDVRVAEDLLGLRGVALHGGEDRDLRRLALLDPGLELRIEFAQ
jgi:hypothetical protein